MSNIEYNVPIKKDGKWHMCCKVVAEVRGGKRVVCITADGTEIKSEPLFRYNERIKRRKTKKDKDS